MKLILLSKQEYTSFVLPQKCAGHYWLQAKDETGKTRNIVAVEASRGTEGQNEPQWLVSSNRSFQLTGKDNAVIDSALLEENELYWIMDTRKQSEYILYTEPLSADRVRYHSFMVHDTDITLTIGRSPDNHIAYGSTFVSGHHAELVYSRDTVMVRDLRSGNRTYVNGKAVTEQNLKNGDVIYIMGLRIVVVGRYLYLNHPDGKVTIQGKFLKEYHVPQATLEPTAPEQEEGFAAEEDYYYRAPRFKHDVDTFELKLDAPPLNQDKDEVPMIMTIGPSMTMGMASVASGAFAVTSAIARGDISAAIPSLVMSLSMLLGTMMWPVITKTYQRRQRQRREEKRQRMYRQYLTGMEEQIEKEIARQEQILRENDIPVSACISRILSSAPQVWERTQKHTDFLALRLGSGALPMKAAVQYSENRFSIEEDNLTDELYRLAGQTRWLKNVPVCVPLAERFISGFYAEHSVLIPYAQSLILQLAALHGYDEVKLALIYDEKDAESFRFANWLPHAMDNERKVRYIATNSDEVKDLSSSLDMILEYRKSLNESDLENETPYYVIFCLDHALSAKAECVSRVRTSRKNLHFSVVSMFERLKDLPKECSVVVELAENSSGNLTLINDVSEPPLSFQADLSSGIDYESAAAVLANLEINTGGSDFQFPTQYSFFEMLDIGMVEHLNLTDRWAANDPTVSLGAPVGIDKYGELLKLDLHERTHGPHGLVAGMTGSGKSEFIISYVLSMAVNFHPYEVAFILIDYKGGGMAKSFENIPHTAGVITNLDGNGIKRSLASMQSELHRRERIFQEVSRRHNVSNIDIYKYQKLYREGKAGEPLPHLFIISDEFAELKKEQPEFMAELTSTARVGRSLGVHLILATQKPGGVVDDQIRSNSSFRVCLKVQDHGDSVEMLGRPEAAALVDTGRFYLQVGYNELFEIGQSAWAGAPYYPSARTIRNTDDAVSIVNMGGRVLAEAATNRYAMYRDPPKQLDVLTEYIARTCEEEGIRRWKMWLDPIPSLILVDELAKKYPDRSPSRFALNPLVGEYDDPSHQAQGPVRIPISRDGNVVVYGSAGNGKEMFLEAMCYSLLRNHSPQDINLYILDFGAEMLSSFARAPHVGDVILSYETEKVENLFKLLLGKNAGRKKLLSSFGGDLRQYNSSAETPEPNLVVIINNYAAFTELYDSREADLNYLTREGAKFGIYFVLTCTGVNNIRFSLRQNFSCFYCLQLNNADDYSTVVGKTEGLVPEKYRGRGLFRPDSGSLFEFQTARVTREDPPYQFFRRFSEELARNWSGSCARRVPVLPEEVTEEFLSAGALKGDLSCVPVGVEKSTLELSRVSLTESPVNLILSSNQEWKPFVEALASMLAGPVGVRTMLLAPSGSSAAQQAGENLRVFTDLNGCVQAARELFALVLQRNNTYKDALAAGEKLPEFEPVAVVIESISSLKALLLRYKDEGVKEAEDDTVLQRLLLAMEKCENTYRVHFIVAESLTALTPFTTEGWYRTHISGNSGIWIGGGIGSQYRLNVNKRPAEAGDDIGDSFGFVIANSSATLVKLLR